MLASGALQRPASEADGEAEEGEARRALALLSEGAWRAQDAPARIDRLLVDRLRAIPFGECKGIEEGERSSQPLFHRRVKHLKRTVYRRTQNHITRSHVP